MRLCAISFARIFILICFILIPILGLNGQRSPETPASITLEPVHRNFCYGFNAVSSSNMTRLLDECSGRTWILDDREEPGRWVRVEGAPLAVRSLDPLRRTIVNHCRGFRIYPIEGRKHVLVDTCAGDAWLYKAGSVTTTSGGFVTVVPPSWQRMERE